MGKEKIAITLDEQSIDELDRLVDSHVFQSRSQAIQQAVSEKLMRIRKTRLAAECAKLKPEMEQELADEGLRGDWQQWPEY